MVFQGFKQVPIGQQTHALVPRVVARGEVFGGVKFRAELLGRQADQMAFGFLRVAAGQPEKIHALQNVFPARQVMGPALGQVALQFQGQRILGRARHHVRG